MGLSKEGNLFVTDNKSKAVNALLSAYACRGGYGSEQEVGWRLTEAWINAASRVSIITGPVSAEVLQGEYSNLVSQGRLQIVVHELAPWLESLPGRFPYGQQIHYLVWQLRARKIVKKLLGGGDFQVFHHLTYATDWMPTALPKNSKVFSVWGPVGGYSKVPLRAWPSLGARGLAAFFAREIICGIFRAFSGRGNARKFSLLVFANDGISSYFSGYRAKSIVRPQVFLGELPKRSKSPSKTKIIGVGRLTPWKGWALALKALAQLPPTYELEIYGTGSDLGRLKSIAVRLGVERRVSFMGSVPREELLQRLAGARCMVHPSIHDTSPNAVGEALAIGVPVAGFDLAGVGFLLRTFGAGAVKLDSVGIHALADQIRNLPVNFEQTEFRADNLAAEVVSKLRA